MQEKEEKVAKQNRDLKEETSQFKDVAHPIDVREDQTFLKDDVEIAIKNKEEGNKNFQSNQFQKAIECYRYAFRHCDHSQYKLRSIVLSNIAVVLIKQAKHQEAIGYCKRAIVQDSKLVKARINLAACFQKTDKIQQALQIYKKLADEYKQDAFFKQKTIELQKKVAELNERRKQQVMGGLKNLGNSLLGMFGMSLDNFKAEQSPSGGYNISFKQ